MPEVQQWRTEPEHINARRIVRIAVFIPVAIAAALLLAQAFWLKAEPSRKDATNLPAPTTPQLQSAPQLDLVRYRAEKEKQIETLDWIDKPSGLVRIPVEDAMRMLAAQQGNARRGQAGAHKDGSP